MSKAVWFISYKLVEGASVSDFLLASEKVHKEIISQQKGYISWEVLTVGDTWVDLVIWETAEDAQNAKNAGRANPFASNFYSFIDESSKSSQLYSVEKSY
jgi:hypothetical protein